MEQCFPNLFEDIRQDPILLLSLVETDIIKQSKFTDNEVSL